MPLPPDAASPPAAAAHGGTIEPPPPIEGARRTARSVLVSNRLAGAVIRSGGMLVILAVVGILVFLVATVLPLFRPATVHERVGAGRVPVTGAVHLLVLDEYRLLAAAIGDEPEVVVFRADVGEVVARIPIPGLQHDRVTVARQGTRRPETVAGTASGRLGFLTIAFRSDFVHGDAAEGLRATMKLGDVRSSDGGVVQRKPGGHLLHVRPVVDFQGSFSLPSGAGAVVAASRSFTGETGVCAVVGSDGVARLLRETVASTEGGGPPRAFAPLDVAVDGPAAPRALLHALVDEEARTAWFADRGGAVLRVDLTATPAVRREVRQVGRRAGASAGLTAFEFVLGDHSLAVADRDGDLSIWSLVTAEPGTAASDGRTLRRLHEFPTFDAPVERIVSSPTRRSLYLGHADGGLSIVYPTNERLVARTAAFPGPIGRIAVGWKDDGALVSGPGLGYKAFDLDNPHPETNAQALFRAVHYEGYDGPEYIYQSSSSTDEAEPKLSLTPLVFGTLKAVFYAMLFAMPLALLAALYTSQFMHPKVRAFVKPGIEVMASLPSVVLGFLAAILIAPAIADVVPAVFAAIFGIAATAFVAGVVWEALPIPTRQAIPSGVRLLIAGGLVVAVAALAVGSVGAIQRALFAGPSNAAGDFRVWLTGAPGTGDGRALLTLALAVVGACVGFAFLPRRLRFPRLVGAPRAVAGLLAWVVAPALACALLSPLVEHVAFADSFRWFLVGKEGGKGTVFDVRNSLVVGIAMGFAVIPVVYTIAEDALSSIPDSLRSAALGCGASPWQTAVRVVVPAAIPGLFSAVMIGLGRAVGETMIVLMATGGTAILDASIFNGFRTLSANIATELPEAPVDGTLYRVLFLAGLLLFALTFVLNTVAESVRLRFRKKFRGL